jgi:epoxyqueuosine reductase QueG
MARSTNLLGQLQEGLKAQGLTFLACANMGSLPPEPRSGLPVGICLGVRLEPEVIVGISRGPTPAYSALYRDVNRLLDELAETAAAVLQDFGHRAIPSRASQYVRSDASLSTPLPHKTVGTLAGVGWIGKCALLVTESYGSAVRYNTVLTNAPLPVGSPVVESRCGDCTECVAACPADAPKGSEWRPGLERHEFYDAHTCRRTVREQAAKAGIEHTVCGICIAACPYTRRYLLTYGFEGETHEACDER